MSTTTEMKPFPVVHGRYLFWFTPEDTGFSVVCQNVAGVNAQGDTFEEALSNALSMAPFVEECNKSGRSSVQLRVTHRALAENTYSKA